MIRIISNFHPVAMFPAHWFGSNFDAINCRHIKFYFKNILWHLVVKIPTLESENSDFNFIITLYIFYISKYGFEV